MIPTICLVMIVRNEEKILRRCIESVRPIISSWCICDTGSTDKTPELINSLLGDLPGTLHHDRWENFGHNRSLGIARAKGKADYHLLLDADMVLNVASPLPSLSADRYLLRFTGDFDYWVERLISDRHDWTYHGVTHEYIDSPTAAPPERLIQLTVTHFEDGGGRLERYQRDTALLEAAIKHEPGNSRYVYYLAQCYRDSGRFAEALEWYQKRVSMGGWNQEIWSALYQVGRMQELLGLDWRVVLNSYLQAFNFRPFRLEPIYRIARFYRENRQYALGLHFSRLINEVGYPTDLLFVEKDVYEKLLPMEYEACRQGLNAEWGAPVSPEGSAQPIQTDSGVSSSLPAKE